ncbi:MAG: hypothetical protein R6U32_04670 [Candidatus Woesearchaeota archaeon]
MDRARDAAEKAVRNLKIADHMLTQTYPSVRDSRLLLSVMENVFLSMTNSMAAILHHERAHKRIPPFQNNFESKFNMFKLKVAHRHNIDKEYMSLISALKNTLVAHKKSPVEFSRKDVFVICSDSYDMKTVSVENVRDYVNKAKGFVRTMQGIVGVET